ncbi:MAG: response regulator [Prochloraceae cyanobacterium]|nr:response regulator [Prochloraceae cyanobacterium]
MTTAKPANQPPINIKEFNAPKQTKLFEALKQPQFSGQLQVTAPASGLKWSFYLHMGDLLYAVGGSHPVRRWRRNIALHLPQITSGLLELPSELAGSDDDEDSSRCWEYELLCLWVEKGKITYDEAVVIIKSTLVEVLFDITQVMQVKCELKPGQSLSRKLALVEAEETIAEAQKLWEAWQNARIADRYPDTAPIIKQPEQMQKTTKAQVYQTLRELLDGQHTLRDLAVQMKREVLDVTHSMVPYIQVGLVELIPIEDLPPPEIREQETTGPLIAGVDDSPLICHVMEEIVTKAGYRFMAINDPLKAVETISNERPDFIFLDLEMPHTNGYELCTQLRKISYFKNTPIVILTGNDGFVDKIKARMCGANEFLNKPVSPEKVLSEIRKYLQQSGLN